jgi:hypothetical protein
MYTHTHTVSHVQVFFKYGKGLEAQLDGRVHAYDAQDAGFIFQHHQKEEREEREKERRKKT